MEERGLQGSAVHPTGMALALLGTWGLSKAIAGVWGWPTAWASYIPTDTVISLVAASMWIARAETWKAMLGLTCMVKVAFETSNVKLIQHALAGALVDHHQFNLTLNLLYGVELLCVLRAGVEWGAPLAIRGWMFHHLGVGLGRLSGRAPDAGREAAER